MYIVYFREILSNLMGALKEHMGKYNFDNQLLWKKGFIPNT